MQTRAGIARFRQTMIERHGSEEAFREHMRQIGAMGGSTPTGTPKGFAANRNLAREAGAKGGRISRRSR